MKRITAGDGKLVSQSSTSETQAEHPESLRGRFIDKPTATCHLKQHENKLLGRVVRHRDQFALQLKQC